MFVVRPFAIVENRMLCGEVGGVRVMSCVGLGRNSRMTFSSFSPGCRYLSRRAAGLIQNCGDLDALRMARIGMPRAQKTPHLRGVRCLLRLAWNRWNCVLAGGLDVFGRRKLHHERATATVEISARADDLFYGGFDIGPPPE